MQKTILLFSALLATTICCAQSSVSLTAGFQGASSTPPFVSQPDTAQRTKLPKTGLSLGITANLPLRKNLFFHTGVVYAVKATSHTQLFDTSRLYQRTANLPDNKKEVRRSLNTQLSLAYIDIPLNLLWKLPLKGKTRFLLSAGPQASVFFNGNTKRQTVLVSQSSPSPRDVATTFKADEVTDLPVGPSNEMFRVLYVSANALAGFEINRVSLMAHYSRGLTPFYAEANQPYKLGTLGFRLAVGIGRAATPTATKEN